MANLLELWLKTCLALQRLAADPLTSYFIVYTKILCIQGSGMRFKLLNTPKRLQGEYKVMCVALWQYNFCLEVRYFLHECPNLPSMEKPLK